MLIYEIIYSLFPSRAARATTVRGAHFCTSHVTRRHRRGKPSSEVLSAEVRYHHIDEIATCNSAVASLSHGEAADTTLMALCDDVSPMGDAKHTP